LPTFCNAIDCILKVIKQFLATTKNQEDNDLLNFLHILSNKYVKMYVL